ncbi:MAG: DPP IV N-terminal domain-containing protein [Segetibacter sp.]
MLDRRGGEGIKLTDTKGDLVSYSWSPDSKKLVLEMKDPKDTAKNKPPQPYLINKFRFKQDITGYQYDTSRTHLYLFDIATKKTQQLTTGIYNESDPEWSPDGTRIAFVSNRTEDPDRNENTDIWIIDTTRASVAKSLLHGLVGTLILNGAPMEKLLPTSELRLMQLTRCTTRQAFVL